MPWRMYSFLGPSHLAPRQEHSSTQRQHPAPPQSLLTPPQPYNTPQQSYLTPQQPYHAPHQGNAPPYQPYVVGQNHPPYNARSSLNAVTNTVFTTTTQPVQIAPMPMVHVDRRYNGLTNNRKKDAAILGSLQILFGLISICVQFIVTIPGYHGHEGYSGFWVAVIFIFAGAFGVHSYRTKSECSLVATLVFSITSAILSVGPVTQGSVGILLSYDDQCIYSHDSGSANCSSRANMTSVAWFSVMLIIGFAEFVVAIVTSVMCCHVIFNQSVTEKRNETAIVQSTM